MSQDPTNEVNPFETTEAFGVAVEELVWQEDWTYTEALSHLVELHQIDYSKVKLFVPKLIIDKIEQEALKDKVIRGQEKSHSLFDLF